MWRSVRVIVCLVMAVGAAAGTAAEGKVYGLVATGVSGDTNHYEKFWTLASEFQRALRMRYAVPEEDITVLFEQKGTRKGIVHGRSTKDELAATLKKLAAQVGERDTVLILLCGHADRVLGQVKWHLPGPDLGPKELAEMLKVFEKGNVVLVMGTPLSGYFMKPLAAKGRIVITATRPTMEMNEVFFPYAFVEALLDLKTDADGDGRISVAELFAASNTRVKAFFDEKKLLVTEHALLDDTGDGHGTAKITKDSLDGKLAAKIALRLKAEL